MNGMMFYTGLNNYKGNHLYSYMIMSIYFSLNEPRPQKAAKSPMMELRADKRTAVEPQDVMEEVMEEDEVLDVAIEAKPQRAKPMRPLKPTILSENKIVSTKKTRKVTFNEKDTNSTPNAKVTTQNETEDLTANGQIALEEHNRAVEGIRDEIARTELKRLLSRTQNNLKITLTKTKQERVKHQQIVEFHTAKDQEHEFEMEQQILKTKIAQESDAVVRNKYSKLKKTCYNLSKDIEAANGTINELKNVTITMERLAHQMEA